MVRKKEAVTFCYTTEFHTTALYVFGYKQRLSSHSDLFKSQNISLKESTHFIFTSLHRNRAFLGTLVWCGTELCKDSCVRSLQTNMHVYIATWRDANLDMEDMFLCPWTISSCPLHITALCSIHGHLHSYYSLELQPWCLLFLLAFSQKQYSLAGQCSTDTACCGIQLTVKNYVLSCQRLDSTGLHTDFHEGWVSLLALKYFIVKQQDWVMCHFLAVLRTMKNAVSEHAIKLIWPE